jgi:hypothetical protein
MLVDGVSNFLDNEPSVGTSDESVLDRRGRFG